MRDLGRGGIPRPGRLFDTKIQAKLTRRMTTLQMQSLKNRHAHDMNTTNKLILDIRRKWENGHIHIITNEIREGQRQGMQELYG